MELDGDAELQQAVRFALFHTLQAGARGEGRAIAGEGADRPRLRRPQLLGHRVLRAAGAHLRRAEAAGDGAALAPGTLDLARERATQLGLAGAVFPWRTIRGHECSGYWPAGTAAFHLAGDIADAVVRYQAATGDAASSARSACELLVETARLWRSLGHHDSKGRFRIDGVTGPDEYSAIADNNVYTNLLAQQNLRAAADAVARIPDARRGARRRPRGGGRLARRRRGVVIP